MARVSKKAVGEAFPHLSDDEVARIVRITKGNEWVVDALKRIDALVQGSGVKILTDPTSPDQIYAIAYYVDVGDADAPTVLFYERTEAYKVMSLQDCWNLFAYGD
jgi:hypothetical protein